MDILTEKIVSYYVNRSAALDKGEGDGGIRKTKIEDNLHRSADFEKGDGTLYETLESHCLYL